MVAVKAAKKSDPESQTYTWSGTHSENCSITFLLRVYKDSPSVVEYALNFLAAHKMLESKEGESLVVAGAMVDQAVLHARMPLVVRSHRWESRMLKDHYRTTMTVDGDVCILQALQQK